jgi:D-arabinose 1-dehydrogenase-like Zn-dependent alcohol dehydrogenase
MNVDTALFDILIRVKIAACGVCRTDLHLVDGVPQCSCPERSHG